MRDSGREAGKLKDGERRRGRGARLRSVCDPVFGAVEDVAVAVLGRRRQRRARVRPVARLAQREAALRGGGGW